MKPVDEALAVALKAGFTADDFFGWCDLAAESGVLYVGPDGLLAAVDEGDAWMVYAAVGDPCKFFSLAPWPRPAIRWVRPLRDPTQARRSYPWDRLQTLLTYGRRKETAASGPNGGPSPGGDSAPDSHLR